MNVLVTWCKPSIRFTSEWWSAMIGNRTGYPWPLIVWPEVSLIIHDQRPDRSHTRSYADWSVVGPVITMTSDPSSHMRDRGPTSHKRKLDRSRLTRVWPIDRQVYRPKHGQKVSRSCTWQADRGRAIKHVRDRWPVYRGFGPVNGLPKSGRSHSDQLPKFGPMTGLPVVGPDRSRMWPTIGAD